MEHYHFLPPSEALTSDQRHRRAMRQMEAEALLADNTAALPSGGEMQLFQHYIDAEIGLPELLFHLRALRAGLRPAGPLPCLHLQRLPV